MNKVYHTEKQEAFNTLMEELEERGYTWGEGEKPTECLHIWEVNKEKTCVHLGKGKCISYCNYNYFKNRGSKITEYKAPKQKFVYHTPTQEAYDALIKELEEQGYTWSWGGQLTESEVNWRKYKSSICIRLDAKELQVHYSGLEFYKAEGYEIIEYKVPKKEKENMDSLVETEVAYKFNRKKIRVGSVITVRFKGEKQAKRCIVSFIDKAGVKAVYRVGTQFTFSATNVAQGIVDVELLLY